MDINKNIKNATYFINKLKADLPNIKNARQKDFTIDMLNSFIVLINTIEFIQKRDPLVKVIESLLLERMYRDLFRYAAEGNGFPLEKVFNAIIDDINNPVNAQLQKMVAFLKMEEITYLVKSNKLDKIEDVSADKWQMLVENKLNDFKNQINWN